jgi:diguanylate cyclase (GGDEF) domain
MTESAAGPGDGDRPRILIVDDTPANLVAMRRLLAREDADLVEAGSGNEALAACLEQDFACILLDVQMPDMDGFEVAATLQGEERMRDTPVIFITAAYTEDLDRLRGYDFGAVDYLAKPVDDRVLRSKVRVFLELYRTRQKLQRALEDLFERSHRLQEEVTRRQQAEEAARHQATHDPLTGLPNRLLFNDRLEGAVERARRRQRSFALMYLDIDGFKPVNDLHGHAAGDALLRQIARRLLDSVRGLDTVARIGGDEFALILEEPAGRADALDGGRRLVEALARPFRLSDPVEVTVGVSIGVAMYPEDASSGEVLVGLADAAMYRAKRSGRGQVVDAGAQPRVSS